MGANLYEKISAMIPKMPDTPCRKCHKCPYTDSYDGELADICHEMCGAPYLQADMADADGHRIEISIVDNDTGKVICRKDCWSLWCTFQTLTERFRAANHKRFIGESADWNYTARYSSFRDGMVIKSGNLSKRPPKIYIDYYNDAMDSLYGTTRPEWW